MSFNAQTGEFQFNDWDRQKTIAELSLLIPPHTLLSSDNETKPYECDGLSAYRQQPKLVILAETIEQIQIIVRYCQQHKIPMIARGAGTGLAGGVLAIHNSIVISLAKFNIIKSLDPITRQAVLEPGVRNLAISEAAAEFNLYYAPDPSSQIACSIGGNVAENSGGVHSLKYGLTVNNVLALKYIDINGDIITLNSDLTHHTGLDLLALMNGSEGMLGIIIEITVRLIPKPQHVQVLLAGFSKIADAGACVRDIIASGIIPAGLELMDKLAIKAAEDFAHAGYPQCEALLICELDGLETEVIEHVEQVTAIINNNHATSLKTAKDDAERQLLWKGRKSAFPAVGRIAPDYYCMDGTIPRKTLPEVLDKINDFSNHYGLAVANVFHAGDGNLHPLILYDANIEGDLDKAEQFGADILELCVKKGGSITGEHGVGVEKIESMCHQFHSEELAQLHAIKAAFDQHGLFNPGKAVPELHRCAELGAMHVHNGKLPHPELERF
ncbi:MAG: FAD-binding protein [Gammaproteobacteria bacterium]|nr:FAD-binding protein [Gammaproteobacteria bacterium]